MINFVLGKLDDFVSLGTMTSRSEDRAVKKNKKNIFFCQNLGFSADFVPASANCLRTFRLGQKVSADGSRRLSCLFWTFYKTETSWKLVHLEEKVAFVKENLSFNFKQNSAICDSAFWALPFHKATALNKPSINKNLICCWT